MLLLIFLGVGERRVRRSESGRSKLDAAQWKALALVAAVCLAAACSAPPKVPFTGLKYWNGYAVPGYYYPVQRGDTLQSIAEKFGCDLDLLAKMNGKQANQALGAGERIFIPRTRGDFPRYYYAKPRRSDLAEGGSIPGGGSGRRPSTYGLFSSDFPRRTPRPPTVVMTPTPAPRSAPRPPSVRRPKTTPSPTPSLRAIRSKGIRIARSYRKHRFPASSQVRVANAPRFQWPTKGVITSTFNVRSTRRRLHLGIDIANKRGTPIRAAYSGRVLYSDSRYLPSMGNMILIEHEGGWVTLYAHNERNLVKEGDYVKTGQVIALMGATGNATGPHLHFEIRKNADTPVNPLDYLPRRQPDRP